MPAVRNNITGDVSARVSSCLECRIASGAAPPEVAVLRRRSFVIHRRPEGSPVPGWLVVAPVRHAEQIDALRPAELRELAPLLAEVAAALRAETPCDRVYVSLFGEALPHLHVHVIARPPGHPADEGGPRLLLAETRADPREAEAVARRVQARLARSSVGTWEPGPYRAMLLSALVCPGLGQIHNGDHAKGLALIALTALAAGAFVWRAAAETLRVLPVEPTGLGLLDLLALAGAVAERTAFPFAVFTAALVVLWGVSVLDAYRGSRQR